MRLRPLATVCQASTASEHFVPPPTQLSVVLEEKTALQAEARSMREQLSHSAPLYGPDEPNSVSARKLLLLQGQMEQLREENFRWGGQASVG